MSDTINHWRWCQITWASAPTSTACTPGATLSEGQIALHWFQHAASGGRQQGTTQHPHSYQSLEVTWVKSVCTRVETHPPDTYVALDAYCSGSLTRPELATKGARTGGDFKAI